MDTKQKHHYSWNDIKLLPRVIAPTGFDNNVGQTTLCTQ